MEITEKDLEDLIFDGLVRQPDTLIRRGFAPSLIKMRTQNHVYWQRQVVLRDYGRADIIGYTRHHGCFFVDIIELKNVPILSHDFNQLCRYKTAVKEIILNSFKGDFFSQINCYLVGPSIQDGHYIHNSIAGKVVEFNYSLDGINFTEHTGRWQRGNGDMRLKDVSTEKSQKIRYAWPREVEAAETRLEDGE